MYVLGIDLGTTFTAAAVWRDGHAEMATLGSRAAAIPSVVLLREDETVLTGETANRRGVSEPHRVSREFKRRLGDTTPILLGGVPYSAESLMARLLRAVLEDVTAREGEGPSKICISHPANWGPYKRELLEQAVRLADIEVPVRYVTEPEAAAIFYAQQQRVEPGAVVAVYDLGGGTFDAAVLRKIDGGFELLGQPEGIERLGGIDFDAAVFAHVNQALGGKLAELDEDDPATIAAVSRLREECVGAKEALSTDTDVSIPVLLPNIATEIRLTRAELEAMVRPTLYSSIEALRRALRSAGVSPEQLHSVLLVGGSSRMPLVAQLVGAELGRPVAVDAHPKHAIALGAAWLASGAEPTPRAAAVPAGPATPTAPATSLVGQGRRYTGSATVPLAAVTPPTAPAAAAAAAPAARSAEPSLAAQPVTAPLAAARPTAAGATAMVSPAVPGNGPPRPPAGPGSGGSGGRRPLLIGAGVVAAVVLVSAVGWALAGGRTDPGPGGLDDPFPANSSPAGTTDEPTEPVPPDEQCTDAIQSNQRWVCLTSATFDGDSLLINYEAEWAGSVPNISGGFHLHVYGGDGTDPPDSTMGSQADSPGQWHLEDQPGPLTFGPEHRLVAELIRDNPKVCVRIANPDHSLAEADSGGFGTGNCLTIERA
jgi:actin-like ATPase involved in cell morphogenesis